MTATWTTPLDIAAKVRRRWDDGTLLRAQAGVAPFEPIEIPVRRPPVSQIGEDIGAIRAWIAGLEAGSDGGRRYDITTEEIGGRHVGRNRIPARIIVSGLDQAWRLLDVRPTVTTYDALLALTEGSPLVHRWVITQPHRAVELSEEMPSLLAAVDWLDTHRDSGLYLREISAPGVDTKFAEKHRSVLAAMLGVSSTADGFVTGLGLRAKPAMVRIRVSPGLGLPPALTELALRTTELAELALAPRSALVVENEITYLSVDVPVDGIVIWGKGFDVDRVGRLPWLTDVPVTYWGDLDTHGFAILDRLRAWLPQTRSVLMDRATLLHHRDRWVTEDRPTAASLSRLSGPELDLYQDLVTDRLGKQLRLEQERIDWAWAIRAVKRAEDRV